MVGFVREWFKKRKEIIKKYAGEIVATFLLCVCAYVLLLVFKVEDEIKNAVLQFFALHLCTCIFLIADNRRYDNLIWAAFYSVCIIFCLNWFFGDLKKAISLPLAYCFYRILQKYLPDEINEFMRQMVGFVFLRKYDQCKHDDNTQK